MSATPKKAIAILCSDLHISAKRPVYRSTEDDWWEAQARPLRHLKAWKEKYNCPVLCAGDVFDRWNASPEAINFSIEHLPHMIAIPGQHDLPHHNIAELPKSAFWTLVCTNRIQFGTSSSSLLYYDINIEVHGFPYGTPLPPADTITNTDKIRIALIHEYIWIKDCRYEGAPIENKIQLNTEKYDGWDIIVYGDNHHGFTCTNSMGNTHIVNAGSTIIRKKNERDYQPVVWIACCQEEAGITIEPFPLASPMDTFFTGVDTPLDNKDFDMNLFLAQLAALGSTDLDFEESLKNHCKTAVTDDMVRDLIGELLEKHRD